MIQYCLSIETTGKHLGLSIYGFSPKKKPRRIGNFYKDRTLRQSETLFPELSRLLKKVRLSAHHLDLISVNVGPGSFTGVRVGLSAARAMAQGLNKPLIGIGGLEVLAYQSVPLKNKKTFHILSCLPALSGEVYYAVYRKKSKSLKGEYPLAQVRQPRWGSTAEFSKKMREFFNSRDRMVAVGDRADHIRALTHGLKKVAWKSSRMAPHPDSLAELAIARFNNRKKNQSFDYRTVVPLYLQPSWAERKHP